MSKVYLKPFVSGLLVVAFSLLAGAENTCGLFKDFTFLNIAPYSPGHEEEVASDMVEYAERTGNEYVLYSLTLHPEGKPAWVKVEQAVASYRRFAEALKGTPVKPGILLQAIIGHWPRVDREIESWQRTVDVEGKEVRFCILDPRFQEYVRRVAAALAKERPALILGDDDIRAFSPKAECFCPLHTAEFNRRTHRKLTSDELRALILKADLNSPEHQAFTQLQYDTVDQICKLLRAGIDAVDPSLPAGVSIPGWVWSTAGGARTAKILAGGGMRFARLPNGQYSELSVRDDLPGCILFTQAMRGWFGNEIDALMDESDTYPHNVWSKSAVAMHAKLVGTIFAGVKGAKAWFVNGHKGPFPVSRHYTEILAEHVGYYPAIARAYRDTMPQGVLIPCHRTFPINRVTQLTYGADRYRPQDQNGWTEKVFSKFGVPFQATFDFTQGGVYAISGKSAVSRFTDAELRQLFKRRLLVDGDAARALAARGFSDMLGCSVSEGDLQYTSEYDEELKCRMPFPFSLKPPVFKLMPNAEALSHFVYAAYSGAKDFERVAPSAVRFVNALGGTVVTTAYHMHMTITHQYGDARQRWVYRILNAAAAEPIQNIACNAQNMMVLARRYDDGRDLVLTMNLNPDPTRDIQLLHRPRPCRVERMGCDGSLEDIPFTWQNGLLSIPEDLPCYGECLLRIADDERPQGLVNWTFPRAESCHEGMAFSDGQTGVYVWGGGDTINVTLGRADLWDHRGGYQWEASQNYSNICALAARNDLKGMQDLFGHRDVPGEPRNPFMLPLGRIVIKVPGAELKRGDLNVRTGLGRLTFSIDGEEQTILMAMSKKQRLFSMQFPAGIAFEPETVSSLSFPLVRAALEPLGFKPADVWKNERQTAGGLTGHLPNPADLPVSVAWAKHNGELSIVTRRAEKADIPLVSFDRVAHDAREYWRDFWHRGASVSIPDAALQTVFDYGMYRFGAMTDAEGVPAGLQGPWLEDDRLVPWRGDYHFNINVQECYSPAFRGGHCENLLPLFRMVLSWRERLRENARLFCGIENGYVLPHSVDDRGVNIGGFWTGTIDHASTAWVASMMFQYATYSGNVSFLREGAYDFMRGAMNVYRAMMTEDATTGRLALPIGPSPEWEAYSEPQRCTGRNPSFQLAAAHRLARSLIAAAALLNEKPDAMWLDVEKRLPLYSCDAEHGILLWENQPLARSHRHHSHLAGFYPFDVIPMTTNATALVRQTVRWWEGKGHGRWTGWSLPWASTLHTHFGQPDAAVAMLRDWVRFFTDEGHSSHHDAYRPGYTNYDSRKWVMQMDGQSAAVNAILEMMVHEVDGQTTFFRGCPESWKDVSFRNIRLSDGRSVSSRRVNGVVTTTISRP